MSFTWPEIPFTGAEVEAFVAAYKELAESIYYDYTDIGGSIGESGILKAPYSRKEIMKELLTNGILYAAFIVKQRAGNAGPGTDFDLSSSPVRPTFSPSEYSNLIKRLGCKFDEDEMQDAYDKSKENDPNPPDFPLPQSIEDIINGIVGNNPTGDPDDNITPQNTPQPDNCSAPTLWESFLLNGWRGLNIGNPFNRVIGEATVRYLSCNKTPLTENDLSPDEKNKLKEIAQDRVDANRGKWPSGHPNAAPLGGWGPPYDDVTNSKYNQQQRDAMGVPPNGRVLEVPFYANEGTVGNLFGIATVIVDQNNNVVGIRDDFDFAYGNEVNRQGTNQVPGDPYSDNQIVNGSSWTGRTEQQVREEHTGINRGVIIDSHQSGRGYPVPINITFN